MTMWPCISSMPNKRFFAGIEEINFKTRQININQDKIIKVFDNSVKEWYS